MNARDRKRIAARYAKGDSIAKIAREHDLTYYAVRTALLLLGVVLRGVGRQRRRDR